MVISYAFPPMPLVGGERPFRLVERLALHGVKVIVLCGSSTESTQLQNLSVVRAIPYFNWPRDPGLRWLPSAVPAALKGIKAKRIDAILITGGPFYSFMAGLALSRICHCPMVVDYRDAWTIAGHGFPGPAGLKNRIAMRLARVVEAYVLKSAAYITFASPRLLDHYVSAFPFVKEKVATIMNGWTEGPIEEPESKNGQKRSMVYAGTLPWYRDPSSLLEGLTMAIKRKPCLARELEILFIGTNSNFGKLVQQYDLEAVVKVVPRVPREQVSTLLSTADGLLSITGESDWMIPLKLIDGIGMARPIISLEPKTGDARDLAKRHEAYVATYGNPESVAEALLSWWHDLDNSKARVSPKNLREELSADRMVEEFARILLRVIQEEKEV